MARAVLKAFGLNRVDLMVSSVPPHKSTQSITQPCHRLTMLDLALSEEETLFPSHWELDQTPPVYTIETLDYFQSTYPDNTYCFLAGSDTLQELHLWKACDRLLENHCFIFVQRPGFTVDPVQTQIPESLRQRIQSVSEMDRPNIQAGVSFLISLQATSVSASSIRHMFASEKHVPSDILCPSVLKYIMEHRLYEA